MPPPSVLFLWRGIAALAVIASGPFVHGAETELPERLARLVSGQVKMNEAQTAACRAELALLPREPGNESSERIGWHSAYGPASGFAIRHVQIDLGIVEDFDAVALVPVNVAYGTHPGPGYGFPVRFRVESAEEASFEMPTVLGDFTESDFPNPGQLPVAIKAPAGHGRFVRVTATRLFLREDRSLFALGELMVLRGDRNLAAMQPVEVSDSYSNPPAWDPLNATDGQSVLGPPLKPGKPPGNGFHALIAQRGDVTKWVQLDLGEEAPIDEVRLFPAAPVDFPARRGFGFPSRFRVESDTEPDFTNPTMLADFTSADVVNPGANPVTIPGGGAMARYIRVTATRLWLRDHDFVFALSEMQVFSKDKNLALAGHVTALDSTDSPTWDRGFLIDGFTSQGEIVGWGEWLRGLSRRRELLLEIARLEEARAPLLAAWFSSLGRWAAASLLAACVIVISWLRRQHRIREREVHRLRQRLANDLHDEIGSNLGSITLLSRLASDRGGAHADLAEIHRIARETADSMRDIVWLMKPGRRAAADLIVRMREVAASLLAGTECNFEAEKVTGPFTLEFERQTLLLFKEALNNIRKHAGARRVDIFVAQIGRDFELRIADDGKGFDPTLPNEGLGLDSMRQRAASLGGRLTLSTARGDGTRITLRTPFS
ncbi:MAG: hypothetical protein JWL90_2466 [Chthoniobacteraceae bacterium]|nr:hypothetical protein [Chthoniobacteraceae bacterium]